MKSKATTTTTKTMMTTGIGPADPWPTARHWAQRRYHDLRSWHELDRGGHFPGLEQPTLLVSEIRDAFRHMREEPATPESS